MELLSELFYPVWYYFGDLIVYISVFFLIFEIVFIFVYFLTKR